MPNSRKREFGRHPRLDCGKL